MPSYRKFSNPKILLLCKQSTYASFFLSHRRQPNRWRKFFTGDDIRRMHESHENHFWALKHLESVLKNKGLQFTKIRRGTSINYQRFDVVITFGGDGTFLEAARQIKEKLIWGVNSDPLWSVGRFCSGNPDNFKTLLDGLLKGEFNCKTFHRLQLRIEGEGDKPFNVLNDILISHQSPAAMSRYYLKIGDRQEEQKSSGIWIATAVGSSGAMYSAGGKILPEESSRIQYRPRELYYHTYKFRGGVLKEGQGLSVTSLMRQGSVFVDGSHVCLPFSLGVTAKISRSPFPLHVVWI